MSLFECLGIQLFVTIHMSVFVLVPLSKIFAKVDSKKLFWKLFIGRWVILLIFDFLINPMTITIIDFLSVFVGAFAIVPICMAARRAANKNVEANYWAASAIGSNNTQQPVTGIALKCAKCGAALNVNDKFCSYCGTPFDGNNVTVVADAKATTPLAQKKAVTTKDFDAIYSLSEDKMIEEFISRELVRCGISKEEKLIPADILKRKKIFNLIFAVLVFAFISMIFFHFPLLTYIVGIIILVVFFILMRRYNLVKYLKKQVQARPSEKISNIVMGVKNTFVSDNTRVMFIASICGAVILPLVIFINPRIMYERMDNGYGVRFYTFGVTNFTKADIPETYKGEPVISLRGNTFSNMPFLKEVSLPDSVTEIRGQAFKNDKKLVKVNIPSNLEYLGGGAFYKCESIREIELPDTLTYMGGEVFYGAKSLEKIRLSNNLPEIRGDSFEYCTSLTSITIPDSVTRIGGHAFYGDSALSEVTFTENSQLTEIGSSAFRMCSSLYEITLPRSTYVNERAFKESPTRVSYFQEYQDDDFYNYGNY